MNIEKIKNRRLPILEQACERYATMAFEKLNERIVIGLRSITYKYYGDPSDETGGFFLAEFTPMVISDCPKKQDRRMTVEWTIVPNGDGHWKLYGGTISVQGETDVRIVAWSDDGSKMLCPLRTVDTDTTGFKGSVTV